MGGGTDEIRLDATVSRCSLRELDTTVCSRKALECELPEKLQGVPARLDKGLSIGKWKPAVVHLRR